MARRIVVFGASGYTGQLVAEALVRAKARPVLAGRNHQSLAAVGVRLGKGLDIAVADVAQPQSLLELIRADDVLVSTAGPFLRVGRPVAEAAIIQRATAYVDSAGEPPFIRVVNDELGPLAEKAGVTLLTAAAFDFVVGELAATLALQRAGDAAVRIDIGYFPTGGRRRAFSSGTRASAGGTALLRQPAFRDGSHVELPVAERVRSFTVGGSPHAGISIGAGEHFWLPRQWPALREVNVYLGAVRSERLARVVRRAIAAGVAIRGAPAVVATLSRRPRSTLGPDPERRAQLGSAVVAIAYDAEGRELATVNLAGCDVYTLSANLLAWEALQLAALDRPLVGARSPIEVFGLEGLQRAAEAAGISEVGVTRPRT